MNKHKIFQPKAKHLMVDIETLGLQETAVPIIAIAAIPFTMEDNPLESARYLWYVEPHKIADIDFKTIKFWMQQTDAARAAAFGYAARDKQHCTLEKALITLARTYSDYDCQTIWCKGLQFDMNNIEFYMEMYKINRPWQYNDRLDVRPLSRLLSADAAKEIYYKYECHDPVQDCLCQIEMVQSVVAQWEFRQSNIYKGTADEAY